MGMHIRTHDNLTKYNSNYGVLYGPSKLYYVAAKFLELISHSIVSLAGRTFPRRWIETLDGSEEFIMDDYGERPLSSILSVPLDSTQLYLAMKFFSTLVNVLPVVLLGAAGAMAQSSDAVISAIQSFTSVSSNLADTVNDLSIVNFATDGPEIPAGLENITTAVNSFNAEFSPSTPPYPDDVAIEVVDVLTTFVEVHQQLLELIIGKHSLAAQFALTAPIAEALRALESVVDTFAFALIDLIPTEQGPALAQVNALNVTFTQTVTTYDS
ncbi:hypothetical protein BD311DRAFT_865480 [Dichomitus squalens]|uniref:Uncharacterized protein n=1 Tax=Dichomitus squalens TaxID=114155 RepID=A0A4Q9MM55_9APHY|nr:hypothetical protein BD311DRAFT_865480 [Dichomitus squalens]